MLLLTLWAFLRKDPCTKIWKCIFGDAPGRAERVNIQISDNQDINPSNQNTNVIISSDDLGTDLKNQIRTTGILDDIKILSETNEINDTNKNITESNILTNDLAIKTSSSIVDTEFISLTNEKK